MKRKSSIFPVAGRAISVFLMAGFLISLFSALNAFSAANLFKIQNATLSEISTNAEGSITSFDETNIVSDVTFHKLNDSAKYTVKLKNTDTSDHIISGVTNDNSNEYVSYSHDSYANTTVRAGESFDFVVVAKYAKAVVDTNNRVQVSNVKFTITFTDIDQPVEVVISPKTDDGIMNSVIVLSICTVGLVICGVVAIRHNKKATKVIAVALVAISAVTITAGVKAAQTSANSITFNNSIKLFDKSVVTYKDINDELHELVVNYGEPANIADQTREGYTMNGWKDDSDQPFDITKPITGDVAIRVDYSPISYTIVFDGNGNTSGEDVASMTLKYNESVSLNKNTFVKDGLVFDKWNTQADGQGVAYEDEEQVSGLSAVDGGVVTLYAQWKLNLLTVNYHGNGLQFEDGSDVFSMTYLETCDETPVDNVNIAHSSNIDYAGNRQGDYGNGLRTKDVVTVDGAESLHVVLAYGTEDGYDKLYVFEGKYTGVIEDDLDDGQIGTYTGGNGYNPSFVNLDIDGDTVTFAFSSDESVNEYYGYYATVIGYDANGDEIDASGIYRTCEHSYYDGDYSEPVLSSDRQIFGGWSEDPNSLMPEYYNSDDVELLLAGHGGETKDLYAVWVYIHFVEFDGNGATDGYMYAQDFYGGFSDYLYYNEFYKEDGIFLGWSTDPNATEPEYENGDEFLAPNTEETTTLYAVWGTPYIVSFDGNGATSGSMGNQSFMPGSSGRLNSNSYSRTGYQFIGWAVSANATEPEYENRGVFIVPGEGDSTILHAIWRPQHKIVFNGNDATGGSMADQYINAGSSASLTSNAFERTSYNFLGWSTDPSATTATYSNGSQFTAPADGSGTTTTLYAIWQPPHTVCFDGNGADSGSLDCIEAPYGTTTRLPSFPYSRYGYQPSGFSTNPSATSGEYRGGGDFTPPTDGSNLTTLYAVWRKKFTVVYEANNGTGATRNVYIYPGDDYLVEDNSISRFEREGYMFVGWGTRPNATTPTSGYEIGSRHATKSNQWGEEIRFYAIWEQCYWVHYDGNDASAGTMTQTTCIVSKAKSSLYAPNYEKDGYAFIGWSTDTDAGSRANDSPNKPVIYGPNEYIKLDSRLRGLADSERNILVHASWLPVETEITLQNFDKTAFESANPGKKILAVRDERDDEIYGIAKQADGNWWMTTDLRLDFSNPNLAALSPSNTNITSNSSFVNQLNAMRGRTDYRNFQKACNTESAACINQLSFSNMNRLANLPQRPDDPDYTEDPYVSWRAYGNYYSYYTAVAGTVGWDTMTPDASTSATQDICAKGWRLPTGGSKALNGEYAALDLALGGPGESVYNGTDQMRWFNYPINMVKSGGMYVGAREKDVVDARTGNRNEGASYYTATKQANRYSTAYFASFSDHWHYPGNDNTRRAGDLIPIRCIAK